MKRVSVGLRPALAAALEEIYGQDNVERTRAIRIALEEGLWAIIERYRDTGELATAGISKWFRFEIAMGEAFRGPDAESTFAGDMSVSESASIERVLWLAAKAAENLDDNGRPRAA